jgi:hypothetical protein
MLGKGVVSQVTMSSMLSLEGLFGDHNHSPPAAILLASLAPDVAAGLAGHNGTSPP